LHAGTDEGVWSLTRVADGDIDGPPDASRISAQRGRRQCRRHAGSAADQRGEWRSRSVLLR
jgi:hypothetical protein